MGKEKITGLGTESHTNGSEKVTLLVTEKSQNWVRKKVTELGTKKVTDLIHTYVGCMCV